MAYLDWDIDTSIFGVCSLKTLPSHYSDFMRQPWHRHAAMGTYTLLYIGSGRVWSGVAERAEERERKGSKRIRTLSVV